MARLALPLLVFVSFAVGCSDARDPLVRAIDGWNGQSKATDPTAIYESVRAAADGDPVREAVADNPLIDHDGERLAIYVKGVLPDRIGNIELFQPNRTDELLVRFFEVTDDGEDDFIDVRVKSIELSSEALGVTYTWGRSGEPATISVPLDTITHPKMLIRVDVNSGEKTFYYRVDD